MTSDVSSGAVLAGVVALTATALMGEAITRRRRCRCFSQLAREWRMNYSRLDQLRLGERVAGRFPVIGAANVRVRDVIYGIENDTYRYVFTAEFTCGAVAGKQRLERAGSFCEPRHRGQPHLQSAIRLAPEKLTLLEQYRALCPPCAAVAK